MCVCVGVYLGAVVAAFLCCRNLTPAVGRVLGRGSDSVCVFLRAADRGRQPQGQDQEGGERQHQPPDPGGPRAQDRHEAAEHGEEGQGVTREVLWSG